MEIVFLSAALVFGGLLLGLGYLLGRGSASRGVVSSPKEPAPQDAVPASAPGQPSEDPPASVPSEAGLQVYADPQRGYRLVVRVDGAAYVRYDGMSPDHRRRMRTYLLQIRDWMEATRGNLPVAPRRSATPPRKPGTTEMPSSLPPAQAQDMVSAINAFVQEKLKAGGSQAAVTVMRDWRGTGVIILVNGKRYDAVADIPNAEVRRLLQAAVREWEAWRRSR